MFSFELSVYGSFVLEKRRLFQSKMCDGSGGFVGRAEMKLGVCVVVGRWTRSINSHVCGHSRLVVVATGLTRVDSFDDHSLYTSYFLLLPTSLYISRLIFFGGRLRNAGGNRV